MLPWEQRPLNWGESVFTDYNDSGETAEALAGNVSDPVSTTDLLDVDQY